MAIPVLIIGKSGMGKSASLRNCAGNPDWNLIRVLNKPLPFKGKIDGWKTAFYSLGGTYEKPTKASEMTIYHMQKAKEKRKREEESLKRKIDLNNQLIGIYVTWLKKSEPLSDVWCDCQNALMVCLHHDEVLQKELERGGIG